MPKNLIALSAALTLGSSSLIAQNEKFNISVSNSLPQMRTEMVELPSTDFPKSNFKIIDENSCEVPWQLTHDGKIIFPVSVGPNSIATFTVTEGKPAKVDIICQASFHPERIDDFAWENDYSAYRAYGPASKGEVSGYDVFTKSNTRPVVAERYFNELVKKISYHQDHGDGMDQYHVGPTLGAGGSAPLASDGSLILPGGFSTWKILDNGPLRTTFELVYEYAGGSDTRTFTLDAYTPFNHVVSHLEGIKSDSIAAGISVHQGGADTYRLGDGYVAYSDPTLLPNKGLGRIFVGVINPEGGETSYLPSPKPSKDGLGHLLVKSPRKEGKDLNYYWGASWSKGKTATFNQWVCTVEDFQRRLANPLKIKVDKH